MQRTGFHVAENEPMTEDADVTTARGLVIPSSAMTWTFSLSSGSGGQHVNKTSTKAVLTIDVTQVRGTPAQLSRILAECGGTVSVSNQTSRSQWRNRQLCLREASRVLDLAAAPPPPPRRKTRPTRGSIERRLDAKRRVSEKKQSRRSTD